jgi:hypothetical protein
MRVSIDFEKGTAKMICDRCSAEWDGSVKDGLAVKHICPRCKYNERQEGRPSEIRLTKQRNKFLKEQKVHLEKFKMVTIMGTMTQREYDFRMNTAGTSEGLLWM